MEHTHRRWGIAPGLLAVVMMAGCAAPKVPFAERLPTLQARPLTVVTYQGKSIEVDRREFQGIWTGNMFSSAGARSAAQKSAAANVMVKLRLEDPAPAIAEIVQIK